MQPTLTTARLILRPYQLSDAADVQRLAGAKAVADMTENVPHPYEDGMAEQWIDQHPAWFANKTAISFAIVLAKSGELVGTVSFTKMDKGPANLGYWIGLPYWGQGICTEAAAELLRYGFNDLAFDKVIAQHLSINPASGRVMQKNGFKFVSDIEISGHAIKYYELTSNAWLKHQADSHQAEMVSK